MIKLKSVLFEFYKENVNPFVDPMKGELAYSNLGHSIGDWMWAYGDVGFVKRIVKTGKENHAEAGWLYLYDFLGRYDKRKNAVTIVNRGEGKIPEDLIQRLKIEFGDTIRMKQFSEGVEL